MICPICNANVDFVSGRIGCDTELCPNNKSHSPKHRNIHTALNSWHYINRDRLYRHLKPLDSNTFNLFEE